MGMMFHLADLVGLASVVKNTLRGCGLAGINVRHDTDVAVLIQWSFPARRTNVSRQTSLCELLAGETYRPHACLSRSANQHNLRLITTLATESF